MAEASIRSLLPLLKEREALALVHEVMSQGREGQAWVARNPFTPVDVLMTLANNPRADVRVAVATNPALPEEVRQELRLNDRSIRVREAAGASREPVSRRGTTTATLSLEEAVAGISDVSLAQLADAIRNAGFSRADADHEAIAAEMIKHPEFHDLASITLISWVFAHDASTQVALSRIKALLPGLSHHQISELLDAWDWSDLAGMQDLGLLMSSRITTKQASAMAKDTSWRRRMSAASLPHLPTRDLVTLLADSDPDVSVMAALHPGVTQDMALSYLSSDEAMPGVLTQLTERFGQDVLRPSVIGNHDLIHRALRYDCRLPGIDTAEAMAVLAQSSQAEHRHSAAEYEGASADILSVLGKDEVKWVRTAAVLNSNAPAEIIIAFTFEDSLDSEDLARLDSSQIPQCSAGVVLEALIDIHSSERGAKVRKTVLRLLRRHGVFTAARMSVLVSLADGFTGSLADLLDTMATLDCGK
jgi:hypothetical protein